MDPQSEKAPGLHLPQPSVGEGMPFHAQYEDMTQKPENLMTPESVGTQQPMSPPAMATSQPALPVDDSTGQAMLTAQDAGLDDGAADDLDKEWINKAKMIVEKTKSDPYVQSSEISKAKADFMRIRYNKHIKVAKDPTS